MKRPLIVNFYELNQAPELLMRFSIIYGYCDNVDVAWQASWLPLAHREEFVLWHTLII